MHEFVAEHVFKEAGADHRRFWQFCHVDQPGLHQWLKIGGDDAHVDQAFARAHQ